MLRRSGLTGVGWLVIVVGIWVNPIATNAQCEVQTLTTDDAVPPWELRFARSVAIGGDRAVIGAKYANGIFTVNSGFAFVYRRDGIRWVEEQRLSPSNGSLSDSFGDTVAISGDRIVVSAWGVQAAYVFRREAGNWVEEAKLVPWDDPPLNQFGRPVSISGDVIVVGAEDDNEAGPRAGAAYVYRRTATNWLPDQKLVASDPRESGGSFGRAIAMDGDYILVADSSHVRDEGGTGWVYVFRHNGKQWIEEQMLIGSDTAIGDRFGTALALSGNLTLIGAPYHDSPSTNVGAVYAFRRDDNGTPDKFADDLWVEEDKLIPSRARTGDFIGFGLALSGRMALLGDSGNSDVLKFSGGAYLFEWEDTGWIESAQLRQRDPQVRALFGARAAIIGNTALILAQGDNQTAMRRGTVFSFVLSAPCHSLQDFAAFQRCLATGNGISAGCEDLDVEPDGDIDLEDYRRFKDTFVGPGGP